MGVWSVLPNPFRFRKYLLFGNRERLILHEDGCNSFNEELPKRTSISRNCGRSSLKIEASETMSVIVHFTDTSTYKISSLEYEKGRGNSGIWRLYCESVQRRQDFTSISANQRRQKKSLRFSARSSLSARDFICRQRSHRVGLSG